MLFHFARYKIIVFSYLKLWIEAPGFYQYQYNWISLYVGPGVYPGPGFYHMSTLCYFIFVEMMSFLAVSPVNYTCM